jgi:colanic acid/amylovoran biosynthesis glycosyltransferase
MKIAFMVGNFPALSETFILNQITGLIDRGHEVDIYAKYARKTPNNSRVHSDVKKYNLLKHTYYLAPPSNPSYRFLKALGLLAINFPKKSAALPRIVNLIGEKKYPASLQTFYQAVPFLNQEKYEIIQCHFGVIGVIGARLKAMGVLEGKVITAFHGLDLSMPDRHAIKWYKELFEVGDLFLPISETWKKKLITLGCDDRKILVHRMGVDLEKFNFRDRPHSSGKTDYAPRTAKGDRHSIEGQTIKILTVARLIEKKGVEYGIRAVAKVIKEGINIEYNIIGDGELREELEQLIRELDASNRIKLLGGKEQEGVINLMEESDLLLAPSVTAKNGDSEGIPVVLMEALAMGLPVISTLHSGIPELIKDGETGFLVPERDVDALAEKLVFVIDNQNIWRSITENGRKFVEQNYEINKLNDRLIEIYQQVLKN